MLGIQTLLQDTRKILLGGEELKSWVIELLNVFLKIEPLYGAGGLLVPQVGKNAGEEISFAVKQLSKDSCLGLDDVTEIAARPWRDLKTTPSRIDLVCTQSHQHLVCAVTPLAYGFDRPPGYFWAVVGESDFEDTMSRLNLAAHVLALHFHSVIAHNALEQLSEPIWQASSTTKEVARATADLCLKALVCSDVIIWELDAINQMLKTLAVAGKSGPGLIIDLNVGAGLAGSCALDNKIMQIDDLRDEKSILEKGYPAPTHPNLIIKYNWRSAMYLPLDIGGRIAGVLAAFAVRPRAFSVLDCNIASAFAQRLCASYVHIERIQQLSEMERAITIEAPAIEAGIMALERVHDADNSLLLAQSHLSEILTRFRHDKLHPVNKSAAAASGHVDSAHRSIKRLVHRAKITSPNLGRQLLKPLLAAAVNEVRLHAETIGVTIKFYCPEDIEVRCDKDLMHRVFMNLLHNALYFLETDSKSGERRIEVHGAASDSNITIRFCDNGPGIAPYDLHKVFNYFYTTKGERGMGFGLAITKGIVTSHGGDIQVRSRWGYETEFIITLPRTP